MKALFNWIFGDRNLRKECDFELRRSGMLNFQIKLIYALEKHGVFHPNIFTAIDEAQDEAMKEFSRIKNNQPN